MEVDPHALTSSALDRSQQAVAKLFDRTIPELAMHEATFVLLDELKLSRYPAITPALKRIHTTSTVQQMQRQTRRRGYTIRLMPVPSSTARTKVCPEALSTSVVSDASGHALALRCSYISGRFEDYWEGRREAIAA